jgi:hypothetical protein
VIPEIPEIPDETDASPDEVGTASEGSPPSLERAAE